jgi:hypothetical protein
MRRIDDLLSFKEARLSFGRALVARGPDGSSYVLGRPTPDSPTMAWRQSPSGERQLLAHDVSSQHEGTEALRRMARLVASGKPYAMMDWPVWGSDGIAAEHRVPVRITRDAKGVAFEPLAARTESLAVSNVRLPELLSGRTPITLPGAARDSTETAIRLLSAMRETRGLLTAGERLRAGAGMVLLDAFQLHRNSAPARRALQRCLDGFTGAIAPLLDYHRPSAGVLAEAASALESLRDAPSGLLGQRGRAWLGGEAAPVLASLRGRLREHDATLTRRAADMMAEHEMEAAGPAFA